MRKAGVTRVSSGLYLRVRESGASYWMYRYSRSGSSHEISLGPTYAKTLAEARAEAEALRVARYKGADPVQERRKGKVPTFSDCASEYIEANRAGWKNEKHAGQWQATLDTYAGPIFGSRPVSDVDTGLVLKALEPIWTEKAETASRLRGRIEAVLDWATVKGYRTGENPSRWKGHLDKLLPKTGKVTKVRHHAALPYAQISAFMAALSKQEGMGARALEFAVLTAARSGEVRGAKWTEIDKEGRRWIIPAERMKAGKEHYVPLSDAAVALLDGLPRFEGTELIFPNVKGQALSDMTLTAVIRRMNDDKESKVLTWTDAAGNIITAHGFRSTFRDWAGETTAYPREVIEHALAHQLKDKAEAAYQRGSLFEKRRALMVDWGQATRSNRKPNAES
ncbi:site-specific integrase [Rhodocyclaceae bacterium]